jgi:hypothetical protein
LGGGVQDGFALARGIAAPVGECLQVRRSFEAFGH